MQDSSQALLNKYKEGDPAALDELLVLHLDSLHGFLRLRCGAALRAHESSTDVAQSVCREILAAPAHFEFRGEAAFRRWLFQAAENKVRDRMRYWGRDKRDHDRVARTASNDAHALSCYASFCSPSQEAIAREELSRIESAFDDLDENYREVILLSKVVGLSNEEIAAQINQTPHYTRTILSRGLARLATLLDQRER